MIIIVDYHVGNCGSIKNMLKRIGFESEISDQKERITSASKIILPGVGSFDKGMENLKQLDLIGVLNQKALIEKVPVLGICLGMQLLVKSSEEGNSPGLGWIEAISRRFQFENKELKVPHMGWNFIEPEKEHPVFNNFFPRNRFYFVHSYYVECQHPENILMSTEYGGKFTSAIHHENIIGVQFHPEKSHKYGMNLLRNFASLAYATI